VLKYTESRTACGFGPVFQIDRVIDGRTQLDSFDYRDLKYSGLVAAHSTAMVALRSLDPDRLMF
jgi:hypothetical protein